MTKTRIIKLYNALKHKAYTLFERGKYETSLMYVEAACKVAYHVNFIYTDDELEELVREIAEKKYGTNEVYSGDDPKKVVFYDYFALDNRGLTQQYLRALFKFGYSVLLIIEDDRNLQSSQKILDEVRANERSSLLVLSHSCSRFGKIDLIFDAVRQFKPSKAFLHMSPWDVVGCTVWNAISNVKRYQVNLTDHAFWLGVNCSDYFLEFRDYGYNISKKYRNIPKDKLLVIPFYPILSDQPFKGMPETKGKIKILSGGQLYKIYGENHKYFDLVKHILDSHVDTVLYFVGDGDRKPFNDFIETNGFHDRVILLGNRSDLPSLYSVCDIYLGTYPFCGGLMSQMAGLFNCPIIAFTEKKYQCNYLESLFPKRNNDFKVTFDNDESFFREIDMLIGDEGYRQRRGVELHESCFFQNDFETLFIDTIESGVNQMAQSDLNIDVDAFCDMYITKENEDLHSLYSFCSVEMARKGGIMGKALFIRRLWQKIRFR